MCRNNLLSSNQGCACCHSLVVIQGINDIPTTDPWMIPYFQGGYEEAKLYSHSSNKKINPICPDCGRIKEKEMSIKNIYSEKSIGCICKDGLSYPEKFVAKMFEQLNIKYVYQLTNKIFDWIKEYRYDFYLQDYNCIIEVHGLQHYENCSITTRTLQEEQENDRIKKQLAINNGITTYIELDCKYSDCEYIKNSILNNDLFTNIIDLCNCNWDECDIFARGSLFAKACNIKKENPSYSTKDIGNILNLDPVTISRYLKKGNKYNLCYYNPEEEKIKSRTKDNKGAYEINVLNKETNDIIKTYISAKILSKNSIQDFGIYFDQEKARHAAKHNKIYKGYKFKYSKDLN